MIFCISICYICFKKNFMLSTTNKLGILLGIFMSAIFFIQYLLGVHLDNQSTEYQVTSWISHVRITELIINKSTFLLLRHHPVIRHRQVHCLRELHRHQKVQSLLVLPAFSNTSFGTCHVDVYQKICR